MMNWPKRFCTTALAMSLAVFLVVPVFVGFTVFQRRCMSRASVAVKGKLAALEDRQEEARRRLAQAEAYDPGVQAERIRSVLEAYQSGDAATRNSLLHSVLEKVTYRKEKKTKPGDFELELELKAP